MAGIETPSGFGAAPSLPEGDLTAASPDGGVAESSEAAASNVEVGSRPVGRDALIYGVGVIMARAASFIMLPVYTRILTPSDYGLLQMLDMAVDVTSLLVSAGSMAGVMRFYFKAETEAERESVIATSFALLLSLNLLGSALLAAFAVPIWKHGLDGAGAAWYVRIAAINFSLNALLVVPQLYMQIRGRAALFTAVSVTKLVIQLSLNILFLVVLKKGPVGILLSTMIANFTIGMGCVIWLFRVNRFRLSRVAAGNLQRFGIPYQIATAGSFILTFGDRFFLEAAHGLASVGIYSFAYQFGFLFGTLGLGPYSQAWTPRRYELAELPRAYRDQQYNIGFFYLSLIGITIGVGIGLFVHPMLRIMSKSSYLPAADLVPVILAAYLFQGWGAEVQFGINVSERTRYSTYGVWISVIAVLALYSVLIPRFGGWGAAIATLISFALRAICLYVFSQRLWPVSYDWGPHFKLAGAAVLAVGGGYFMRPSSLVLEIGGMCLLFALYAAAVWIFIITPERRADIKTFIGGKVASLYARLSKLGANPIGQP